VNLARVGIGSGAFVVGSGESGGKNQAEQDWQDAVLPLNAIKGFMAL
jgi:hypothetical protein